MDFSLRTQLTERIREELSNISRRTAGTESKKFSRYVGSLL